MPVLLKKCRSNIKFGIRKHMRIEQYIEHDIQSDTHGQITVLRNACFPDCQHERSYFKQLPHFRFLAFTDGMLIGHLGIDHRMMSFNHIPHSVFGIVDLCVHEGYRNRGLGLKLLSAAESLAMRADVDAMVLLAQDSRLYEKHRFVKLESVCQWLRVEEHTNFGVAVEEIKDELMVKPIASGFFACGPVDFLGYMF